MTTLKTMSTTRQFEYEVLGSFLSFTAEKKEEIKYDAELGLFCRKTAYTVFCDSTFICSALYIQWEGHEEKCLDSHGNMEVLKAAIRLV